MHEETDLRHQRQRKRSGHAPECEAAQRGWPRPARRRGSRTGAQCRRNPYRRPIDPDGDRRQENSRRHHRGAHHRGCKSDCRNGDHQHRRHQDAAGARAVERQADREPALAIEPQAQDVADGGDVHRRRPYRHEEIDGVELPKRGDEGDESHGAAEAAGADQHHSPRSQSRNRIADKYHQGGGEQVVGGGGAGDGPGRPTVKAIELRQVDAVTVKPEPPAAHGNHEAGSDDAPAGVARRRFVDVDRPNCRIDHHGCDFTLSRRKPRSPEEIRAAPIRARPAEGKRVGRRRERGYAPLHRRGYQRDAPDTASP